MSKFVKHKKSFKKNNKIVKSLKIIKNDYKNKLKMIIKIIKNDYKNKLKMIIKIN